MVETYDGAIAEAGDMLIPISNKAISDRTSWLICMRLPAEKSQAGSRRPITLFKSLGCALEDLVTAQLIYHQAMQNSGYDQTNEHETYDFAVIGAGVFGAWTAHHLRRSGASVALLDAYGPANSRASSGGETRVIRMGYGPDELYTRWSMRSLPVWREFAARIGREIFHQTGVLWLSNDEDAYLKSLCRVLGQAGVEHEELNADEIARRWPQLRFHDVTCGVLEPTSGLLLARTAVQSLVKELVESGVEYLPIAVEPPHGGGKLAADQSRRRIHIGGNIYFLLRPVAAENLSRIVRRAHISHAAGSIFSWGPGWQCGFPSAKNAGMAASHASRSALRIA